jgi:hypothetical protein
MAVGFLLIDGYNLMHALSMARVRYGPGDLERCRHQLLGFLVRHLSAIQRERTTVVFDAGNAPADAPRHAERDGIRILYPAPGGDADTLIEELIDSHSAPRQLRIVSGDHRLQRAASRRRAGFVDSDVFVDELTRRGPVADETTASPRQGQSQHPKFSGKSSQEETESWLEIFGDIPGAAELDNDREHWQSQIDDLLDNPEDESG